MSETENSTRQAVRFANYNGRVVEVDMTKPMGPNTFGERLWPVSVTYDEATNRSRVGFSFTAPKPEVSA